MRPAYRLRGRDLDDSVDVAALRLVACQPFNRRDGAICTMRHVVENESSIHTANTGREWPPFHAEPMLDTVTRRYRNHGPKHLSLLLRGQPKKPDLRTRACDHAPPTLAQESLALDSTHTTLGSLHQHPRDQADDQEQQRHASHNDEPPRPCLSSFVHRRRRVIPANRSPHLEQRNRSDFAPFASTMQSIQALHLRTDILNRFTAAVPDPRTNIRSVAQEGVVVVPHLIAVSAAACFANSVLALSYSVQPLRTCIISVAISWHMCPHSPAGAALRIRKAGLFAIPAMSADQR